MTPEQSDRLDKRAAAIHEVGHLTVALYEGSGGSAWLERNTTRNVAADDKSWLGKFHGKITPAVAVAGIVAEVLEDEPGIQGREIVWYLEDEICIPSDSDKQYFPPAEQLEGVVAVALAALKEHKTFFDWAVSMLVEGEVITDGMAREHFENLNQ